MKCSNVLAWASLACAVPALVIESRGVEATQAIYDTVNHLQQTVELSRNDIAAAVDADKSASEAAYVVRDELETIVYAIVEAVVLVSKELSGADRLDWLVQLDQEDVGHILGSLGTSVQIAKELKDIIDTVTSLPPDIHKELGAALSLYIKEIEDLISE